MYCSREYLRRAGDPEGVHYDTRLICSRLCPQRYSAASSIRHRVITSRGPVREATLRETDSPAVGESAPSSSFDARSPTPRSRSTMPTTFKTALAIGLAAICTAGLTAQTQETKTTTKTKTEIKGGKDVTVIGCLDRYPNGHYILTDVRENRRREPSQYALVTSEDLSRHVGERVEI